MTTVTDQFAPMQVYSLHKVTLVDKVPMLERQRNAAKGWLETWTPANSFMHLICSSDQQAINYFRAEVRKCIEARGYPAENFEFSILHHPVKIADDGSNRFWVEAFISMHLQDRPVVMQEVNEDSPSV